MREKPSSHSCWPICRGTNSGGRSLGTRATTASDRFPAGISSSPWRLPNSADGNLCAISRLALCPLARDLCDDRFVLFPSPLGNVPKDEGRRENAYASGFAGIDPDLCGLDFRGGARRPFPGRGAAGRGVGGHNGSWISRLRAPLRCPSPSGFLRDPRQTELALQTLVVFPGGQDLRSPRRSNHRAYGDQVPTGLPGVVAPRRFLRRREPSAPCVSDSPVHRLSEDCCRYL